MSYGATPEDWLHFDMELNLTPDLLPVVSNPAAVVSNNSTLKAIGKTPSKYNSSHEVVGIANWTSFIANPTYINSLINEPDYGICIQTRRVRAIDVDVSDAELAGKIDALILINAGILPKRKRSNSTKFLLAVEIPGPLTKRILKTQHGAIEFLADGQQFIAAGTHPSGARYEWDGGLPAAIPVLSVDEFNALWFDLEKQFAVEPSVTLSETRQRDKSLSNPAVEDDITRFLDAKWIVYAAGQRGERYIECPFKEEHSGDSGPTATAYFPAGTGGFTQGHFRCLHAHCSHRNDGDFMNAIGYRVDDFDIIPTDTKERPFPAFKRDAKGLIEPSADNTYKALSRSDFCSVEIRFDQFKDEIMIAPAGTTEWRAFTDEDYTRLQIQLERRDFKSVSRENVRYAVGLVAKERPFDSAIDWLNGLKWDGVSRIETFLTDYLNAEDNDYTRAVSRYMWTALAGRVLSPGIKADMVPILVGPQGIKKSSSIAALVPDSAFFTEVSFAEKDDDLSRKMRGKLVAEIGELRGLHTKELESIKAFVTRTHENWVPKFKEFSTQFPRRLVFFGTTNKDEFLADETGNRRWLPVDVEECDVDNIKRDALLLWAEARDLFNANGVSFREAEQLAERVHGDYTMSDPWQEIIEKWLDEPDPVTGIEPRTREFLRVGEILINGLGVEKGRVRKMDEQRVGRILPTCGFLRVQRKIDGKNIKVWVKVSDGIQQVSD